MTKVTHIPGREIEAAAAIAWNALPFKERMFLIEGLRLQRFDPKKKQELHDPIKQKELAGKTFAEIKRVETWFWIMCCNAVLVTQKRFPQSHFAEKWSPRFVASST